MKMIKQVLHSQPYSTACPRAHTSHPHPTPGRSHRPAALPAPSGGSRALRPHPEQRKHRSRPGTKVGGAGGIEGGGHEASSLSPHLVHWSTLSPGPLARGRAAARAGRWPDLDPTFRRPPSEVYIGRPQRKPHQQSLLPHFHHQRRSGWSDLWRQHHRGTWRARPGGW